MFNDRTPFDITQVSDAIEGALQTPLPRRGRNLPPPTIRRHFPEADIQADEPATADLAAVAEEAREPDAAQTLPTPDYVNHPPHYTSHPSGIECITITEWMNFNVGNAVKYLWRAGEKGNTIQDLKKARWYVDREIARLEKLRDGS